MTRSRSLLSCFALAALLLVAPVGARRLLAREASPGSVVEVFDVRDLAARPAGEGGSAEARSSATEALVEAIRLFVTPPLDAKSEDVKAIGSGYLVARVRPEQRDWIARFLDRRRGRPPALIRMQVSYLTASEESARRLGLGQETTLLDTSEERREFLERAAEQPGVEFLSSPTLTTLDAQQATITIGDTYHFVTDHRVYDRVEPVGGELVVPVVTDLREGLTFRARGAALDGGMVGLEFELEWSKVVRPVETRSTDRGEIALPKVESVRVGSTVVVADGATLVFPRGKVGGKLHVMVIRATLVKPEGEGPR